MTVSGYHGSGIDLAGGVAASGSVYIGWVGGFEHGISDWDGFHLTASTEIGFPFIKECLHLKPEIFTSVQDQNHNDMIDLNEIKAITDGLHGFSIGVGLAIELIPDPLPISLALAQGQWVPHNEGIAHIYKILQKKRLFPVLGEKLAVQLINEKTGEACAQDWPHGGSHDHCIIKLGRSEWSHTRNGLHIASSMCALSGGCHLPFVWGQSMLALAIGAWRDHRDDLLNSCQE